MLSVCDIELILNLCSNAQIDVDLLGRAMTLGETNALEKMWILGIGAISSSGVAK